MAESDRKLPFYSSAGWESSHGGSPLRALWGTVPGVLLRVKAQRQVIFPFLLGYHMAFFSVSQISLFFLLEGHQPLDLGQTLSLG